jgi:pimeloyl-ACP methyl ester carboxylesterase
MSTINGKPEIRSLDRRDGAVAYEVNGTGPLIICIPGMGELRSSFRFLAPQLLAAGYRVAMMDLRGHGDSDHSFAEYGDGPTAGDIQALTLKLGGPAILVGNSMSAGSAVLVAAQHPEIVSGLVLLGPFVRDPDHSALARLATKVLMARLWAVAAWNLYLPKLYAGTRPADFSQYRAALTAAMRRPGYARAFSLTTRTRHHDAAQALPVVRAPALVVMGEQDPDFPDPTSEAHWITDTLHGELLMVPQAGHYPHSQRPDIVGPAVTTFARQLSHNSAQTPAPPMRP